MARVAQRAVEVDGRGRRFAIVASRFNEGLVDLILEGAVGFLREHGVAAADIEVLRVPGAWEIAQAAEEIAARGSADAIVTLGVVIRGETPHFDILCAECARALGCLASKYRIPVTFGILTCDTEEHVRARAGGDVGNKGREAAQAALEMTSLFEELRSS